MRPREALGRLAKMIFPWPVQQDRKAAVHAARREKEHSRDRARHAAEVEQQIQRLTQGNHFAEAIADQIITTHRKRGGK